MSFNHKTIEKKWQDYWEKNKTFETDMYDFSKPKYYILDMFPYPSGQGLHVGHPEGYTASDIIARYKRMQGFNVFHPMGWDAFGLPAEQYAIKTGNHPAGFTEENIATFKRQLKMLGFSYDWSKEISTADPSYYKWTQWIFKQMFEDGLAKYIDMPVNWCEELGTVLANDEIIDGKSERGGYPVIRKNMKQWVLDIPKYASRLLQQLQELDWPESTKEMQRNWIGKSEGAHIKFQVENSEESFTVFTTRCDTLFGVTYCVLAPEHVLIDKITTADYKEKVEIYKQQCAMKSEMERTELNKDKTGVFTGAYALHPITNKKIPIWISDYVLVSYGTGAIMAVPAHDQRDYEFAKAFQLEILPVIEGGNIEEEAWENDGPHIHSEFLDGLYKDEAIRKMSEWLKEHNLGSLHTNYRLREWIFARQRYWGEPIPVVHYQDKIATLADDELPLILPELSNYAPNQKKESPLMQAKDWINYNGGIRETSTMPGSAGSSWYFMRYLDPNNEKELADKALLDHWLPVDLYIGGSEHAVGHLLYSRFWNNYLHDKGILKHKEPFQKLCHQGMILGENGEKMSKSRGNVVNPDDIVQKYGADTLRIYEMFMGPLEASKPWNDSGVEASRKWLERVYRLFTEHIQITDKNSNTLDKVYHFTVKKITNDIETLGFNTAISQMMIFINECYKVEEIWIEYAKGFIKMLSVFAPHIAEELWQILFHAQNSIAYESWPIHQEQFLVENEKEVIVQVNGKLRGKFTAAVDASEEELKELAFAIENVKLQIEGKQILKTIIVKGKVINIVVK